MGRALGEDGITDEMIKFLGEEEKLEPVYLLHLVMRKRETLMGDSSNQHTRKDLH